MYGSDLGPCPELTLKWWGCRGPPLSRDVVASLKDRKTQKRNGGLLRPKQKYLKDTPKKKLYEEK